MSHLHPDGFACQKCMDESAALRADLAKAREEVDGLLDRARDAEAAAEVETGRALAAERVRDEAVAEVARLKEALAKIRDYEAPSAPLDLNNDGCEECQRRTAQRWPPSGLCEKHYGVLADNRDRNEASRNASGYAMRDIARRALGRTDGEGA